MRLVHAAIVLLAVAFALTADAHDLPIERQAVLQLHPTHAELLLVYNEPAGPRTDRLLALYDNDRNGQIDGVEGKLAKPSMLRRAFLGLEITFADATTKHQEPEIRYKRDRSGGLAAAVFRRTDLIPDEKSVDVTFAMAEGSGLPPLELVIEIDSGWVPEDGQPAKIRKTLASGDKVTWSLKREAKAPRDDRRDWTPPKLPTVEQVP